MSDVVSPREWRFYVEDMIAFCDKALAYTKGLDRLSLRDRLDANYQAVSFNTVAFKTKP